MTGKRKQLKRRGFDSKHEAKLALAKLQFEVSEAKELSLLKLPFQKYLVQWFDAKKIKLKPSTIQNYEEQIRYNIVPYIGDVRMDEWTSSTSQSFRPTSRRSTKSVNRLQRQSELLMVLWQKCFTRLLRKAS